MSIILLKPLLDLIEITKSKSSPSNTVVLTNTITLAITLLILNGGRG